MILKNDFYNRNAVIVAKELLGKILVRRLNGKEIQCMITETEAYMGPEDKACHAYNNKRTKRTDAMFKQGGHAYVYLIYGMYYCLNVVTGDIDKPEAVLIRAVDPITGLDTIVKNRKVKSNKVEDLTNGPGKLCQALRIDKQLNGYNLVNGKLLYIIRAQNGQEHDIVSGKRINIDYAEEYKDKLWRFSIK